MTKILLNNRRLRFDDEKNKIEPKRETESKFKSNKTVRWFIPQHQPRAAAQLSISFYLHLHYLLLTLFLLFYLAMLLIIIVFFLEEFFLLNAFQRSYFFPPLLHSTTILKYFKQKQNSRNTHRVQVHVKQIHLLK